MSDRTDSLNLDTRANVLCPLCRWRIPIRKMREAMEREPDYDGLRLWACLRGPKGHWRWCSATELVGARAGAVVSKTSHLLRSQITQSMISWLQRFAVDIDGAPLVIDVKTADDVSNERTARISAQVPIRDYSVRVPIPARAPIHISIPVREVP